MCPARISSAPASTSAREDVVPPRDRLLARRHGAPIRWWWRTATRSAPSGASRAVAPRARAASSPSAAGLVPPRPHRVEPDDEERRLRVDGLGRLPLPLELRARSREARRERVRDVVVPRDDEQRPARARAGSAAAGSCCSRRAAVREVAARDDELRFEPLDERSRAPAPTRRPPRARRADRRRAGCVSAHGERRL